LISAINTCIHGYVEWPSKAPFTEGCTEGRFINIPDNQKRNTNCQQTVVTKTSYMLTVKSRLEEIRVSKPLFVIIPLRYKKKGWTLKVEYR